jgi:hypothetical protein
MSNRDERLAHGTALLRKLGDDIAAWLASTGKDVEWLGAELQISPAVVRSWVRGLKFPHPSDLATILSLSGGYIQVQKKSGAKPRTRVAPPPRVIPGE